MARGGIRGGIDHEGIGKLGMTYKANAALAAAVAAAGGIGTTVGVLARLKLASAQLATLCWVSLSPMTMTTT